MNHSNVKNKAGFSLLEALVSISILITAFVGILTLASRSIGSASLAKNQIIAFNLAEEAVELVRYVRDSNSIQGLSWLIADPDSGETFYDLCQDPDGCLINILLDPPYREITRCPGECQPIKYNPTTGRYGYSDGNDTIFRRTVTITPLPSGYEAKIEVKMDWQESFSSSPGFTIEESIFDWR